MIKVVEVIDEMEMGGAQHVVHRIISHLDKTKFDVTIVCFKKARPFASMLEKQVLDEGYKIVYLNARKRKWKYLELMWVLTKIRPHVIHAHQTGIVASVWGFFARVKTVVTIHTAPARAFIFGGSKKAYDFAKKTGLLKTVGISAYNRDLCQKYWHLADGDVYCVNNGIDIDGCVSVEHPFFSFINVGRQDENKNQMLIIRAFSEFNRRFPDSETLLYLVGDGDQQDVLKEESKSCGLEDQVIFTGYISDPKPFLEKSDVYISSSHREGLSLSVLEGMAYGLPVIATDVGGVRDLAQENGILIADEDLNAMVDGMCALYSNRKMWKEKHDASLEMVKQYTAQGMADGYAKIFEECVK